MSPPVDSHVAELTVKVTRRVSSTTTSCFSHQPPPYSEVRALTDSSKASLLFFCRPSDSVMVPTNNCVPR